MTKHNQETQVPMVVPAVALKAMAKPVTAVQDVGARMVALLAISFEQRAADGIESGVEKQKSEAGRKAYFSLARSRSRILA